MERESLEKIVAQENYKESYKAFHEAMLKVLKDASSSGEVAKEMAAYLDVTPKDMQKFSLLVSGDEYIESMRDGWVDGTKNQQILEACLLSEETESYNLYNANAYPEEKLAQIRWQSEMFKIKAGLLLKQQEVGSYAVASFLQKTVSQITDSLKSRQLDVPKKFAELSKLEEAKNKKLKDRFPDKEPDMEQFEAIMDELHKANMLGPTEKTLSEANKKADEFEAKYKEQLQVFVSEYGDDPSKFMRDLLGVNAKNELPYSL